jgi:hypothetical protein
MSRNLNKRVFVPLTKEAYDWFKIGKQWEVRKFNVGQYNLKNIVKGREVELRLGYRPGNSTWGIISEVSVFDNISEMLNNVMYKSIIPTAETELIARDFIEKYIGKDYKIIAFRINKLEKKEL